MGNDSFSVNNGYHKLYHCYYLYRWSQNKEMYEKVFIEEKAWKTRLCFTNIYNFNINCEVEF